MLYSVFPLHNFKLVCLIGALILALPCELYAEPTLIIPKPVAPSSGSVAKNETQSQAATQQERELGSWSDIVQAIVSVVNIFALVWLFVYELRKNRREKQQSHKRDLLCFRIRSLILESNVALLHGFFWEIEKRFRVEFPIRIAIKDTAELRKHVQEEIIDFKRQYHAFCERIIDPLIIVAPEFAELQLIANQAEDLATNYFALAQPSDLEGPCSKMRSLRNEFLAKLFEAEDKLLKE